MRIILLASVERESLTFEPQPYHSHHAHLMSHKVALRGACQCVLQVDWSDKVHVVYGVNYLDSTCPLPCFHLTLQPVKGIYFLRGILRNAL